MQTFCRYSRQVLLKFNKYIAKNSYVKAGRTFAPNLLSL